ncbi:hypothetical protein NL42_11315 [Acinetobacter sp. GN11]
MELRAVKMHKMFKEFHDEKALGYMGEYDEKHDLVAVYNIFKEKMKKIDGTYQWILPSSGEVFFVEEDPLYVR